MDSSCIDYVDRLIAVLEEGSCIRRAYIDQLHKANATMIEDRSRHVAPAERAILRKIFNMGGLRGVN